jgi:Tol biopolymer transport system component
VRLSANGRTVAFLTSSRNLLPGGTDGMRHVLVKDLDTGALERASVSSTGTILASVTDDVFDLSADGRKVAFVSVRGDTKDVLIRDLDAKTTSRVWSGKGAIGRISLSADGTKVAFVYRGSPKAVYLADTTATTLQRVSLAADTFRDTGPYVAMSGDGRTVAYAVRSGFVVVDLATGKRKVLPGDGGYLSPRALSAAGAVLIGLQFSGARLELWRR